MVQELINQCGTVCDVLAGKYPVVFSIVGLCIVVLIFIKLRQIDKFVTKMHREAEELKAVAQFPFCTDCSYRDICPKRLDAIKECSYEYRKTLASS